MRKDSFEMIACQSAEVKKRFPFVAQAVCMQAMQLILPDGEVLSGEKALPEIVKRLKRFSPAAAIFDLPGSEILSRSFYRWFADNRYHIANVLFPDKKKHDRDTT
jgi:predicted DCC family thiol-disulfide oxidoreductase YuxK